MWFTVGKGQPGHAAGGQRVTPVIGRITFAGEVREFPLPFDDPYNVQIPYALTAGNDGAMWYLREGRVGRVTEGGQVSEFPVDTGNWPTGEIVSGSDGNLWFTKSRTGSTGSTRAIVRVTFSGQATEFPLPAGRESSLTGIVPGPDGNLWFADSAGFVGRITPSGQVSEFPVGAQPQDIVAGHDGNLWFSTCCAVANVSYGVIGHISTDGTVFPPVAVEGGGALVAGPDLRLWFGPASGTPYPADWALGRITPDGRRSSLVLPPPATSVVDLAVGMLGTVWYLADGDPPCEGGGGSCMAKLYIKPGVIGRIEPGRPVVSIKKRGFSIHHRWARIRLACFGGEALGRCRGSLSLESRAGVVFTQRRFLIRTDEARMVPLRLLREGREAVLDGRRLRLIAAVDHPEGTPTKRGFMVPPKRRR